MYVIRVQYSLHHMLCYFSAWKFASLSFYMYIYIFLCMVVAAAVVVDEI